MSLIIIEDKGGVKMVSSLTVSRELGVENRATIQTIEKYLPEIEASFGRVAFEMVPLETPGGIQQSKVAYLTEDQSIFIATLSRNSQQVVQFKARLVQAFQAARKFINKVTAPLTKEETIMQAMKYLQADVEMLQEQNSLLETTIKQQAPAVMYANQVLQSSNCYTTTSIAKELGMGAPSLNKKLKELGVQYFHDDHWVLYQQHQNKGYTQTRTHTYYDKENNQQTSLQTVWTEKGRAFIHGKLNPSKAVA